MCNNATVNYGTSVDAMGVLCHFYKIRYGANKYKFLKLGNCFITNGNYKTIEGYNSLIVVFKCGMKHKNASDDNKTETKRE